MRNYLSAFVLLISSVVAAQELNCTVKVDANQITNTNTQIFKNLEKSISEFVNMTKWTNRKFEKNEQIDCSMYITINSYESNNFSATIQVQSSRPGFNSNYNSPVLNLNDKDFNFSYIEFQNMVFNKNTFDSNLLSTLAFYAHLIIGLDADTYALKGGDAFLATAQEIVNVAQGTNSVGWIQGDNKQNKYYMITDLMSNQFESYRQALYQYHYEGIDQMVDNQSKAKENITASINKIAKIYQARPNALLLRMFFDAKTNEIVSIFTGGIPSNTVELRETLTRISPLNQTKWNTIK
ncbi:MAG: DUF4835 family protein [Flavobacterium sp.]|nr:DUF4835 family protein [Candidatus Neoflavobacterium equi]